MTYTLTLNGSALPKAAIDGITINGVVMGSSHRTPDATLRAAVLGDATTIKMQFVKRSQAERDTTKALFYSLYDGPAVALVLPWGDTFYVLMIKDGYQEHPHHMGASSVRWDMAITCEEV